MSELAFSRPRPKAGKEDVIMLIQRIWSGGYTENGEGHSVLGS